MSGTLLFARPAASFEFQVASFLPLSVYIHSIDKHSVGGPADSASSHLISSHLISSSVDPLICGGVPCVNALWLEVSSVRTESSCCPRGDKGRNIPIYSTKTNTSSLSQTAKKGLSTESFSIRFHMKLKGKAGVTPTSCTKPKSHADIEEKLA